MNGPSKTITVKGVELHLDMLSAGLLQLFSPDATLEVGGKALKVSALLKDVDSRRVVYKTMRDLRNQLHARAQEKRVQGVDDQAFLNDVKIAVKGKLGRTNPDLPKVGFKAEHPRAKLTTEQKAVQAAKARATRAARHTLGSRQRESIRGEVATSNETQAASPKPTTPDASGKVA
jgi:hypothetical protein